MFDMQSTGGRIANARREKGFTQDELSERLGVTAQAVSKWERGLSLPDVEMLCSLAKLLDVSVDSLVDASATLSAQGKGMYDLPSGGFAQSIKDAPIQFDFGLSLTPSICGELEKGGFEKISRLRADIFRDTGVLIPSIRIMDDAAQNAPMQCHIRFFGKVAWEKTFDGEQDAWSEILTTLDSLLRKNLMLFVNRHMIKLLVERLRQAYPFAVEGVVPDRVGLSRIKLVCRALAGEGISIRNFLTIAETLDDLYEEGKPDLDSACLAVKKALEFSIPDEKN